MNKTIEQLAKEYAGFEDSVDPNSYDERYYQAQKCAMYDAFIAGYEAKQKQLDK